MMVCRNGICTGVDADEEPDPPATTIVPTAVTAATAPTFATKVCMIPTIKEIFIIDTPSRGTEDIFPAQTTYLTQLLIGTYSILCRPHRKLIE